MVSYTWSSARYYGIAWTSAHLTIGLSAQSSHPCTWCCCIAQTLNESIRFSVVHHCCKKNPIVIRGRLHHWKSLLPMLIIVAMEGVARRAPNPPPMYWIWFVRGLHQLLCWRGRILVPTLGTPLLPPSETAARPPCDSDILGRWNIIVAA